MTGDATRLRRTSSPQPGKACASAAMTAVRFASAPPLVKVAIALDGRPNLLVSQPRVCRSISFAAGEVRQLASCGLYAAASVSATTEESVTLGLNRPK